MGRRKGPTISDVAKAAGVARSTVSHVFNGTAPISDATKDRVIRAALRLGYVPRRQRRKGPNPRQVVIFKNMILGPRQEAWSTSHEDLAEAILAAAYPVLRDQGVDVWIVPFEGDEVANGIDERYLTGFAGALVIDSSTRNFSAFPDIPLPTVLAYCTAEAKPVLSVVPDNFRGGYEATRHLIRHGRRRIAFVSGPMHWSASHDRLNGYVTALHEFGLEHDPALTASGDWSVESGARAVEQLLGAASFDGLFVANDLMAVGAVRALKQTGLRVPEDVAVVGFDNRNVACLTEPALTTVQLPLGNIGRRAALELLDLISQGDRGDETSASRIQIHCPLVVRESCGCGLQGERLIESTIAIGGTCDGAPSLLGADREVAPKEQPER